MTKLDPDAISTRSVEALSVEKDTVFWDRDLAGFGVRVQPSGAKVYIVQSRGPDGPRRIALGRHGVISADEARRRAAPIIARIKAGADAGPHALAPAEPAPAEPTVAGPHAPAPVEPTIAALARRYLREHVAVRCKPATAAQYRAAIDNYILPALGALPVSSVGRTHVAELQHGCCDRPAMANLVVATLSRMIDQAMAWGLIPDGSNPCRFTRKYRERRRERFLTDAEFRRLGRALDALEAEGRVSVHAGAALRLLILTGCRRNEILTLRWEDVHPAANELRLRDSKTGPRAVSLSPAAVKVLAALPRVAGNPHVIPGARPGARLSGIFEPWRRVRTRAGLDDVRIHDLRHSYASRALALGESLPVIAKLLGHSRIQTTARYAHLTRDSAREAAARVAASIGADILPPRIPRQPRAPAARDAVMAARDSRLARDAVKASAARIAADIGADILPPRQPDRAGAASALAPAPAGRTPRVP